VLQDGVVRRVGSEGTDAVVNVRIIAATNGDPDASVRSGDLREDLYYRIRVVPLRVPSLRERPEDIPRLAEHFLRSYWARHRRKGAAPPGFTDAAFRALSEHVWRGNVRELQNLIEHTVVLADPGSEIGPDQLGLAAAEPPAELSCYSNTPLAQSESYHAARDRAIADFERQYLTWLIHRAGGNKSKAARIAGVDRTTLYRLMQRDGLHTNQSPPLSAARDPVMAIESAPGSQVGRTGVSEVEVP
jgi:DNA-binding NtrC family response regulator